MILGNWHIEGDGITGWAQDSELDAPIWVELWAGEESLGIARADLPEPKGCGFWLPLSSALLENEEKFKLRAVNTNISIPEETSFYEGPSEKKAVTNEDQSTLITPLIGDLSMDRGLTITGWVIDPLKPERQVHLNALVDGYKMAETVAGRRQYRPIEADGHGFNLSLPVNFADGRSHVVEVMDDSGRIVPGSPIRMRSIPENAANWLKKQKKPEKPLIETLANILEMMEERLPGLIENSNFQNWKKAFPVEPPRTRHKAAIGLIGISSDLVSSQQGGDFKLRTDTPDYYLIGGNTSWLHPLALARMLEELRNHDADAIYADSESATGQPLFKTAWDREAFLAQDFLGPVLVKAEIFKNADFKASDTQAARRLKLLLNIADNKIAHLPELLSTQSAPLLNVDREAAINEWLCSTFPNSTYEDGHINYHLSSQPLISIIIPTRDHGEMLNTCLASLQQTSWPNYEIIIVDNGTVEEDALQVLQNAEKADNICVLRRPGIFNYAALNNEAVSMAKGELVCFLNNDTEALHPQWLTEMSRLLLMAGDSGGCVGAKLLWPNGLVQHGGVIVGCHQLAAHVGNQWLDTEPGYMGRNQYAQRYSAVTAACLLTPRNLFLKSGGFDSNRFPIAFNDADYCLRIVSAGKKIFWTPNARLAHHESASRGKDLADSAKARAAREMKNFRTLWGHYDDPFYNPNLPLSAVSEPFTGLAFPPRPRETR